MGVAFGVTVAGGILDKVEPACQRYFFGAFYPQNRVEAVDGFTGYHCGKFQVGVTSITPVTSRDR